MKTDFKGSSNSRISVKAEKARPMVVRRDWKRVMIWGENLEIVIVSGICFNTSSVRDSDNKRLIGYKIKPEKAIY